MSESAHTESSYPWHALPSDEVVRKLDSSRHGLSADEAASRLERSGLNQIEEGAGVSPWSILGAQFRNVLVVILLIATVVSAFVGHTVEAIAIIVIVLFAVVLGFVQEYRAERAIEALREMTSPTATAVRDGEESEIAARELVPGDVILLHTGDKVPADVRLLESANLQADEAALTGESTPVGKRTEPVVSPDAPVSDRVTMAWAGTAITRGRGRAIVVATGMATQFGQIAGMLESVETSRTPLQENLDHVGRVLGKAALAIVGVIVGIGLLRGQPFVEMLIFGIALAVAVVPEALPAVVTISLAIGVTRMARRNVLVRRLPAVETLGSTSIICSDKTGTITRDEMTVRRIDLPGESWTVSGAGFEPRGTFEIDGRQSEPSPALLGILSAAVLASDARLVRDEAEGRWEIKGDPTEGALVVAAAKAGVRRPDLEDEFPRKDEISFTSERKRMTTLHRRNGSLVAWSKGAPEVILESCSRLSRGGSTGILDQAERQRLLDMAQERAGEALRVLAFATKPGCQRDDAEEEMVFLGLIGMIDPPRPEVVQAVETCHDAGIEVVMITGDHPTTACAVASEVGILSHDGPPVTGPDLDQMDQETLERRIGEIDVYARVSPAHKLRIVQALQNLGHVTAMTGDGVNDGPPLKQADIGIAMGITGTQVSKEAAAMTLTDDNFASIVAAVEEGRGIFNNIEKYLMYLLSSNIGEIGLIASAALAGLPMPLTAVQILYVNLATDGLPALALAVDPPESDLMNQAPRDPRSSIFTRPILALMGIGGVWSAAVNLGIFIWALDSGRSVEKAMTMTFVSLVLIQFFKAYNFRSVHHSVLDRPFANRWLNLAILWEIALLSAIVYFPLLMAIFETRPLSIPEWLLIILGSFTVVPVLEMAKWIQRRKSART